MWYEARENVKKVPTCGVCGVEALALYWGVGVEHHVHVVGASNDGVRHLATTVLAEAAGLLTDTVKHLDVVVRALLMRLQLKVIEHLNNIQCG